MKRLFSLTAIALLAITAITTNLSHVSAETIDGLKEKINDLERQQGDLKQKQGNVDHDKKRTDGKINKNLDKQGTVESEINTIDKKLSATKNEIQTKENEITKTNAHIEELGYKIIKLKKEIVVLKERIEKRDALLKDRLRAIQQSGGSMKYIEVILDSQSFGDFISRSAAVNTIMDQDKTIMEEQVADKLTLEDNKVEVENNKAEVEEKRVALEGQKKELVALKGQLDSQMAKRQTLMAKLEDEHQELEEYKLSLEEEQEILVAQASANKKAMQLAQSEKGKLEQLAREKAAKEKAERERAAREQAEKNQRGGGEAKKATNPSPPSAPPSSGGNGLLIWPAAGSLTSNYGYRVHPITGERKLHSGIDIGSPVGTTLKAAASGVVISSGPMGTYGNAIFLSHVINGTSYTTVYAHLNSVSVSPGQTVSQGQVIGATGNTGGSTGPHLHFEVHIGGWNGARSNSVNPLQYLP